METPRAGRLHQRPDPARPEEAARLPGVRQPLHAEPSAGRDHGVGGGRLRRLLRVRPASRRAGDRAVKDAILRKARESADVKEQFFRAEADRIEALRAGDGGARSSAAAGSTSWATAAAPRDAQHVAVEFCPSDRREAAAAAGARADQPTRAAHRHLQRPRLRQGLRRPAPAAGATRRHGAGAQHERPVAESRPRRSTWRASSALLTIAFTGKDGGRLADARRSLLRGAVLQHPPHPGDARRALPHRLGPRACRARRRRCPLTRPRRSRAELPAAARGLRPDPARPRQRRQA